MLAQLENDIGSASPVYWERGWTCLISNGIPANMRRCHNAGSTLVHPLRRWTNFKTRLCQLGCYDHERLYNITGKLRACATGTGQYCASHHTNLTCWRRWHIPASHITMAAAICIVQVRQAMYSRLPRESPVLRGTHCILAKRGIFPWKRWSIFQEGRKCSKKSPYRTVEWLYCRGFLPNRFISAA